jgi:protein ImuB
MHWIALQPAPEPQRSPDEAAALVDVHTALAWAALQFTPMVARVQDALVMEVSASERLFGGREALSNAIQSSFHAVIAQPQAAGSWLARGESALLALGRLWCGKPDADINSLPLHTLLAARAHLPTLTRLGCNTWGQLRALPRGGVARRFGAELLSALDRAYGLAPEVYPWSTLPEVFDAPLELSASVESAPALLFGARRLLAQLQVWLRVRQRGVLALEWVWELDARRSNALNIDAHHSGNGQGHIVLRTAEPTQDMQHLQRLLGEQLARVQLPAPVMYLRCKTLQTQPLSGESASLLPEDVRTGDSLHQTLERISARLGPAQVLCVHSQADHLPEHMQRWQPWTAQSAGTKTKASTALPATTHRNAALYPTWLLEKPLQLRVRAQCPHYYGPLALLVGPQRLETGWLQGAPALRDYFIARSERAGLLWIYRERLSRASPQWYLHGLFA